MELGLRVSELTNLTLDNIDILGQRIDVYGRGNKRKNYPLKETYQMILIIILAQLEKIIKM